MTRYRDEDEQNPIQNVKEQFTQAKGGVFKRAKWIAAGVVGLGLLNGTWFTVDPNDRANVRRLGSPVYSEPLQSGLHFKLPLVDSVDRVQTSLTTQEIPSIDVGTVDNQRVKLDINFNYDIPDNQVNRVLYRIGNVGNKGVQDQVEKTVESVAVDVIATRNMNTLNSELESVRATMQDQTFKQLADLYGIRGQRLQIKAVTPSDEFKKSNEAAVNAKNAAVAAENQLKTVQFQAQQKVAAAQGDADSAVKRAEGGKQAAVLEGQGNQSRYEAEIKAFGSPANYVAYVKAQAALKTAEKWDGAHVPAVVSNGGGTTTPVIVPLGNLNGGPQ